MQISPEELNIVSEDPRDMGVFPRSYESLNKPGRGSLAVHKIEDDHAKPVSLAKYQSNSNGW